MLRDKENGSHRKTCKHDFRWVFRQTDWQTDRQTNRPTDRQTDIQTDRPTDWKTDRQTTDRQTYRQTHRPTDRPTNRPTDGQTDRQKYNRYKTKITQQILTTNAIKYLHISYIYPFNWNVSAIIDINHFTLTVNRLLIDIIMCNSFP